VTTEARRFFFVIELPKSVRPIFTALDLVRSTDARAAHVVHLALQLGVVDAMGARWRLLAVYLHGAAFAVMHEILELSADRESLAQARSARARRSGGDR